MIRVNHLTKRFGSLVAVNNVSFKVEEGEIVGFLGPNGAGKSTTIRILTCYQPATSGTAHVAGFDVFTQSMDVRRKIGYLPESAPLYPEMRVREYLDFRAKLHGLTKPDRVASIKRVAERCWLTEFIDRPIGQLSKGMRQRVGLADALIHDPPVLILDEPTVGLDPTQIRETRKLIAELAQRHTILLSSHILHEIEQTCSRAIIIAAGQIVASGSPAELRDRVSAESRLIAELKGPADDVKRIVQSIDGVKSVELTTVDGWNHLAIESNGRQDVREDLFRLAVGHNWALREIRREVASLEDFFVRITAEQRQSGKA